MISSFSQFSQSVQFLGYITKFNINSRINSEAVSSTDKNHRVTVDDCCSTAVVRVITVQDPAGPGELILLGGLPAHCGGAHSTTCQ